MGKFHLIALDVFLTSAAETLSSAGEGAPSAFTMGAFCFKSLQILWRRRRTGQRIDVQHLAGETEALNEVLDDFGIRDEVPRKTIQLSLEWLCRIASSKADRAAALEKESVAQAVEDSPLLPLTSRHEDAIVSLIEEFLHTDAPEPIRETLTLDAALVPFYEEDALRRYLETCPSETFGRITNATAPPPEVTKTWNRERSEQIRALFDWAKSASGPGLGAVYLAIQHATRARTESIAAKAHTPASFAPAEEQDEAYTVEGFPPRDPFFTGRGEVFKQIQEALLREGAAVISQTRAVSPLGGIGKTAAAFEYVHRHGIEYTYVFWVSAESEASIMRDFEGMAEAVEVTGMPDLDPRVLVDRVLDWIEDHPGGLLVYDGVDDPEWIESVLPEPGAADILLTTPSRQCGIEDIKTVIELGPLSEEESLTLLLKRSGRDPLDEAARNGAEALALQMGGIPLAIELAAAHIAETGTDPLDYLARFRGRRLKRLESDRPLAGWYPRAVWRAWELNVDAVRAVSPESVELLRLLADDQDEGELEGSLFEPLVRYALIQRSLETGEYRMHGLLKELIRDGGLQ